MNKLARWISIIGLVFCTLLTVHILDLKSKDAYLDIEGYEVVGISFNNDLNLSYDKLEEIVNAARQNHIVLAKLKESRLDDNTDVYLSSAVGNETISFLSHSKNVNLRNRNCKSESACYITTENTKDKNVYGDIKDFLANNTYHYYSLERLIDKQQYIFGDYAVYYTDYKDYELFVAKTANILNVTREGIENPFYQVSKSSTNYFIFILGFLFLLQLIFHFIFQVFSMYNQSRKISILKLQGHSDFHIFKRMSKVDAKYLIFLSTLMLLGSLLLPNITIVIFLIILFFHIFYISLTMLSCYLSVRVITMRHRVIDLLKNKVITSSIVVVAYIFKCIITIVMSVLLCMEIVNLTHYMELKKVGDNYQYMENYSYFPKVNIENEAVSEYGKFNQFYKELYYSKVDCIYADFSMYNYDITQDDMISNLLKKKQYFLFGSVDANYVIKEGLDLMTLEGVGIDVSSLPSEEILLFPKSKIEDIDDFKKFFINEFQSEYNFEKETVLDRVYVYRDKQLKTFAPTLDGTGQLDAPILRKIDVNSNKPYFDYMSGLNIAGTGEDTALKINSNNQNTYDEIYPFIEKVGLSDALTSNNYYTYQDYFSGKLDFAYSEFSSLLIVVLCILFFYMEIIINTSKIYTEWKVNTIVVKSVLGFKKFDIFKELITLNVIVDMISYSISLIIVVLFNMANMLILLCLVYLVIIVLNVYLSMGLVDRYTKKKKTMILKGERI